MRISTSAAFSWLAPPGAPSVRKKANGPISPDRPSPLAHAFPAKKAAPPPRITPVMRPPSAFTRQIPATTPAAPAPTGGAPPAQQAPTINSLA